VDGHVPPDRSQHPVYLNTGGGGFARPVDNWLHVHVKRYTYLYNEIGRTPRVTIADVMGEDMYPSSARTWPRSPPSARPQ